MSLRRVIKSQLIVICSFVLQYKNFIVIYQFFLVIFTYLTNFAACFAHGLFREMQFVISGSCLVCASGSRNLIDVTLNTNMCVVHMCTGLLCSIKIYCAICAKLMYTSWMVLYIPQYHYQCLLHVAPWFGIIVPILV